MEKLVFNTSMPRAGSELLQAILHQNPRIYASATSPLLEYQFAARGNYGLAEVKSQDPETMQSAFLSMCKGMADSYYAPITDRPVVCDKNRGWSHYFEWVEQWTAKPRMICMVRDLRSIIASFEKIYRKTRHMPVGPDNAAEMVNMTAGQRAGYWLNSQPVGLALQRTADLFQRSLAEKILFVRYEDLTRFPKETMGKIYDYIGEPEFQHDYKSIVKAVPEDDSHYGPYGSHSIGPVLKAAGPADWQSTLPPEVAASIQQEYGWYAQQFGYHNT